MNVDGFPKKSMASSKVYLLFVQDLHGEVELFVLVLRQHDASEGAGAEGLQPVEVLEACRILKKGECW